MCIRDSDEITRAGQRLPVNLGEMIGKCPGHDDLAHVVDETGDVNGIVRLCAGVGRDFAGENGGADAVLPEFAPGKSALPREALKIFDDGRDHRELADLAHAQIKNGFLNAVDRRAQAVIDGIDQSQQPRSQTGIAADDFRDLCGVTLFRQQQSLQRLVDAAQ